MHFRPSPGTAAGPRSGPEVHDHDQVGQSVATSAALALTASAAARSDDSSDPARSRSTTRFTPPAPISASTPRYTPEMPYSPSTQAQTGITVPLSSATARAIRAAAADGA